jgi:hypothetical protein
MPPLAKPALISAALADCQAREMTPALGCRKRGPRNRLYRPVRPRNDERAVHSVLQSRPRAAQMRPLVVEVLVMHGSYAELDGALHRVMRQV